jgi:DNA-binding CsgD family transcriptional regulator
MQQDDQIRTALARLTENEKECLRRRMWPQTAKEMAVELGISPHAVEKRLKMARAKLGLTSSLAAARLLVDEERYQPSVPHLSELPSDATAPKEKLVAAFGGGVLSRGTFHRGHQMFAALFLAALVGQDMPGPSVSPTATVPERLERAPTRKVGMDEAAAFIRMGFRDKDKDASGELDPRETSQLEPRDDARDKSLPAAPLAGRPDRAAERKWMAKLDTDRNGKVSEQEYVSYLMPWILWQGVPTDWHPATAAAL